MQVIIVGAGKLAKELLGSLELDTRHQVVSWEERAPVGGQAIVVHAGSGRELATVGAFCEETASPLIELSTGSAIEDGEFAFPVVLCPNTNILMLKFMAMLEVSGPLFRGYGIELVESHQASKTSVPGTAVSIAHALGLAPEAIQSVRKPSVQHDTLHIPENQLARHAFHRIRIEDGACSVQMETRVYGDTPYASGVARIVEAVHAHPLENRVYPVMEFITRGWL